MITENFIDDIRVTAIEGGVDYWTLTYNPNKQELIYENPDADGYLSVILDDELITRGIDLILSGKVSINKQIKNYIQIAYDEQYAGHIDVVAADCIVQAGIFGEIVYG